MGRKRFFHGSLKSDKKERRAYGINRLIDAYRWLILGIVMLFLLCVFLWAQRITKTDYRPVEAPVSGGTAESDIPPYAVNYNFYLDFSPSMGGFFQANQNSMTLLAEVLNNVNRNIDNKFFYRCTDKPEAASSADSFYDSMRDISELEWWYQQKVIEMFTDGETDTENLGTDNEQYGQLMDELSKLDLSSLFYSMGDGTSRFQSDKSTFNMIIIVLNFYITPDDTQRQTQLMEEFSGYMETYGADANICIYCFYTLYLGDELDERKMDNTASESKNRPFFLIMFSQNDDAYFEYRDALEAEFENLGLAYMDKFELLNDPVLNAEGFQVNTESYRENGWIIKSNLNFDSKRFEGMEENGMGLCLVQGNEANAENPELEMPVGLLELSGYSDTQEDDGTEVEVRPRIFYPKDSGYREYQGTGVVRYAKAGLKRYGGQWYVHLKMTLDMQQPTFVSEWPKFSLRDPYYIVDLGFYMKRPSYSLPAWLSEMPQDKTEGISEMYEAIIASKERAYEADNREGNYLGNLVLYIHY